MTFVFTGLEKKQTQGHEATMGYAILARFRSAVQGTSDCISFKAPVLLDPNDEILHLIGELDIRGIDEAKTRISAIMNAIAAGDSHALDNVPLDESVTIQEAMAVIQEGVMRDVRKHGFDEPSLAL